MDGLFMPIEQMTYWHVLLVAGSYGLGVLLKRKTPLDNAMIPPALFLAGASVGKFTGLGDWLLTGLLSTTAPQIIHELQTFIAARTKKKE